MAACLMGRYGAKCQIQGRGIYFVFKLQPPQDDGLYIPKVGEWSKDKHYFLRRYIDAFTTSMKGKWSKLYFIDLFSGAGIERLEQSGELDWGSPMIAAKAPKSFDRLYLCERDRKKYEALSQRINSIFPGAYIIYGDANKKIHDLVRDIPSQRTLSLAFLETYQKHKALRKKW